MSASKSRPTANRAASDVTNHGDIGTLHQETKCSRCKESARLCDLHGCPYCHHELNEQKPWIDPCQTCVQLRDHAFWSAVDETPGWRCEYDGCVHCSACSKCSKTGEVCRDCELCIACEDDGMRSSPCEYTIWSKARRREVEYFQHTLYDPITGRWGRLA